MSPRDIKKGETYIVRIAGHLERVTVTGMKFGTPWYEGTTENRVVTFAADQVESLAVNAQQSANGSVQDEAWRAGM